MPASCPASMVNQKPPDLGILNRFKLTSSRFSRTSRTSARSQSQPPGRIEGPATDGRDGVRSKPGRTGDPILPINKPVRERDRDHLRFVASQPCLVCGRGPSDAHHIRFADQRAMGRKVSDKFAVPVCRLHHRELHRRGDERAWWGRQGIDPLPFAAALWERTHAVGSAAAELAGDLDRPTKLNGEHLADGFGAAVQHQIDETKPIVPPEAG